MLSELPCGVRSEQSSLASVTLKRGEGCQDAANSVILRPRARTSCPLLGESGAGRLKCRNFASRSLERSGSLKTGSSGTDGALKEPQSRQSTSESTLSGDMTESLILAQDERWRRA